MITCTQAMDALHQTLDSGRPNPPQLTAHLRSCPACRQAESSLRAFEQLAKQSDATNNGVENQAGFPPGLHARIMNAIANEPAPRAAVVRVKPRGYRLALGLASAAAVLMLAVSLAQLQPKQSKASEAWLAALIGDASGPNRTALQKLSQLPVIPREVVEGPELLASAENSLTSLGYAIFSATGSALRAVSSQPGVGLEAFPAPTPKG